MIQNLKTLIFSRTALDALIALGGSGFSSVFGFIFVSLVARKIGPEEFGIFSTIVNYVVFLSAVIDLGISFSLVRFVQDTKSKLEKQQWLSTGLVVVTASAVVFSVLASIFYYYFLTNIWHHQPAHAFYIFPTIIVITLSVFFMGFYQSLGKFWQRSLIDNMFSIARLIFIGVIIVYSTVTINWSMSSIIFGYTIALISAWLIGRNYLSLKYVAVNKIKQLLSFSKWMAVINLFGNLYGKLDVMMLAWLTSAYATGIYAAAARFILIFPLVVSSLSSVVSPRFARFTNKNEMHDYFKKTILISVGLCGIMSILIVIARPLIVIPYSQTYAQAIPIFQLLVASYLPLIMSIPATNAVVFFFKKPQHVSTISFIQLVGLVILNLILIPKYKIFGPVFSLIAMNFLGMTLQYLLYFKYNQAENL